MSNKSNLEFISDDEHVEEGPDWRIVMAYFGLDTSFQWTNEHIDDYSRQYLDATRPMDTTPSREMATTGQSGVKRYKVLQAISGEHVLVDRETGQEIPIEANAGAIVAAFNASRETSRGLLEAATSIIDDAMDQFEQMERMFRDDLEFMDVLERMRQFQEAKPFPGIAPVEQEESGADEMRDWLRNIIHDLESVQACEKLGLNGTAMKIREAKKLLDRNSAEMVGQDARCAKPKNIISPGR